ncbi:type II secretion system secretin GspD [Methylocella tundrae]|uniref:type II secretion system secretin GspD n=1 Tax=Methylocella tundrae TaxID=227605 RepID=UPI0030FE7EA0|nr:type II secretion system secretin GspD [Methylocella tundrae]
MASCSQLPLTGGGTESPDAFDKVRGLDLQPRFPKGAETANTGASGSDRPAIYYGVEGPAGGAGSAASATGGGGAGAGEGVDLNFDNAPVTAVAKVILGDILGVGYSVDPRVQGSITLSSGRPVPKSRLLFVLESALRTANAVLTHDAGGYRIIPVDDAVGNGGVDHAGGELEPGYGMTIVPVQHVAVPTIMKLLEGFATRPGSIRADPGNNLIIVVGNGVERRTAVETILSFDQDWMRGQSVGIFPVRNTSPEPVVAELEKILDSGEAGLSQNMVKLQPIARSNAILVVARKPELLRAAATWISRLDGSSMTSTGVKVYRVRYGDAKQIAKLLNDLFTGGAGGGLDSGANQLAPGSGSLSAADRLTGGGSASSSGLGGGGAGAGTGGGIGGGAGTGTGMGAGGAGGMGAGGGGGGGFGSSGSNPSPFGGLGGAAGGADTGGAGAGAGSGSSGGGKGPVLLPGVRIMADIPNNAIVIYANQQSYHVIEKALEQIDRPKLQVAVDLTIAEVTLNDTLNYGVQFFLGSSNLGLGINNGSITNTATAIPLAQTSATQGGTLPGFNLVLGNQLSPHAIINALHQYTNVKVLSNPSLVVVDNQVATLQVGQQVPIQTGSATVLSANNAVVNTIDYKDTGIILRVQPRVNFNGNVSLDIEQEISAQVAATTTLGPTFTQRKVKSSINVASGQTVLLAGLIQDQQGGAKQGIPVLDQIPVLGNAFNNNAYNNVQRTELIIFIRPQVIHDGVDASFVAEELRAKLRGEKVGSVYPTGAVTPVPTRALQQ